MYAFWKSLDIWINVHLLMSKQEVTISHRAELARVAYKNHQSDKIWGCVLCRLLDTISKNHCENSIE